MCLDIEKGRLRKHMAQVNIFRDQLESRPQEHDHGCAASLRFACVVRLGTSMMMDGRTRKSSIAIGWPKQALSTWNGLHHPGATASWWRVNHPRDLRLAQRDAGCAAILRRYAMQLPLLLYSSHE
jgi:hypothetical protein